MQVTRKSILSGNVTTREIEGLTPEMLARWENGELIQNAMPMASTDDREFIMTGITPEEWSKELCE